MRQGVYSTRLSVVGWLKGTSAIPAGRDIHGHVPIHVGTCLRVMTQA
jgi:hypothetical protein